MYLFPGKTITMTLKTLDRLGEAKKDRPLRDLQSCRFLGNIRFSGWGDSENIENEEDGAGDILQNLVGCFGLTAL